MRMIEDDSSQCLRVSISGISVSVIVCLCLCVFHSTEPGPLASLVSFARYQMGGCEERWAPKGRRLEYLWNLCDTV